MFLIELSRRGQRINRRRSSFSLNLSNSSSNRRNFNVRRSITSYSTKCPENVRLSYWTTGLEFIEYIALPLRTSIENRSQTFDSQQRTAKSFQICWHFTEKSCVDMRLIDDFSFKISLKTFHSLC